MINYEPFWYTLKKKNISTYALINQYNISSSFLQRLRTHEYVSLRKLDELCQILDCSIEDIVEIYPDNPEDIKKLKQKAKHNKKH